MEAPTRRYGTPTSRRAGGSSCSFFSQPCSAPSSSHSPGCVLIYTYCQNPRLTSRLPQNYGWVQTVALVAIEFIVFVAMCIFTPFNDKSSNGMNITIQILRCIISGALIVFNRSIGLNEIIRCVELSTSPSRVS